MIPFKSLLSIDKLLPTPVFIQVAEQLTGLIRVNTLAPGHRLPGTRQLAGLLGLHRQTVVAAYNELLAQGWLDSRTGSGTFVAQNLPVVQPQKLSVLVHSINTVTSEPDGILHRPGYSFESSDYLVRPVLTTPTGLRFDDGFPDIRLAPMDELSRAYRSYFRWGNPQQHFGYGGTKGHPLLREQLSAHLNETRGLHTTLDNILITRGSIMGLHLASTVLLRPGDAVVTGETTWAGATMNFRKAGANLLTIPVDQHGIVVDALAELCEKQPVRLVFVTPHHHYPTTVTLRPDRRIRLRQLAEHYGFVILEDDYDYDFHYLSRPILPLASADPLGMVVYVGSLTKSVAPAFRVGYVVAPTALIDELARLRRIIDRQGDPMLEFAIGQLFKDGDLKRHFRKALRTYLARRDRLCSLLANELPDTVRVNKPDGGLAIWANFDPAADLEKLAERAGKMGLFLSNGLFHNPPGQQLNSTRLGFASSTEDELEQSVALLKKSIRG